MSEKVCWKSKDHVKGLIYVARGTKDFTSEVSGWGGIRNATGSGFIQVQMQGKQFPINYRELCLILGEFDPSIAWFLLVKCDINPSRHFRDSYDVNPSGSTGERLRGLFPGFS